VEFPGIAPIRKADVDAESVGQASVCLVLNFDDDKRDLYTGRLGSVRDYSAKVKSKQAEACSTHPSQDTVRRSRLLCTASSSARIVRNASRAVTASGVPPTIASRTFE